jgi:hypothetical protein
VADDDDDDKNNNNHVLSKTVTILIYSYVCNANVTAVGSSTIDRTIEMSGGKFTNTTGALER